MRVLTRSTAIRLVMFAVLALLLAALAHATPAGAAEISATTASSRDRDWYPVAMKWEKRVKRAQRHARQHARMLGVKVPRWVVQTIDVPFLPGNVSAGQYDWHAWAYTWRKQYLAVRRYVKRTWRRMRYPNWRAKGAAAWLPLAKHAGWPRSTWWMLERVITRESGGDPRLIDPGSCYVGLMQIGQYHSPRLDFRNPNTNLKYALDMWRVKGWQPWASTAY